MEYVINFTWDDESGVWIATSNDIPGLVLESGSFDALLERTRFAVPELLELNAVTAQPLSLTFRSERHERMSINVPSSDTSDRSHCPAPSILICSALKLIES